MPSNILVTGATGFIGSHLINKLTDDKKNNLVIAIIRDTRDDNWNKYALKDAVKVFLDITSPTAIEQLCRVLSHYHIDQIFHLAAQPIVQRAKQNPVDTYKTNIMGSVNVFDAARQMGVKDILTMSTDKVFGEGMKAHSMSKFQATEPYSSSKICAEYIAEDYRREYDLGVYSVRCCNIVGYDLYNPTRIVPNTILKILNEEKPIIYDTNSIRQYIFIDDVIRFIIDYMERKHPSVFNIGSPHICKPSKIITLICKLMNAEFEYIENNRDFHEIQKQSLKHDSGFKYTSLEEMIRKTIKQFRMFY